MNRIIKHREHVEFECNQVFFPVHGPGWGYSFDCDQNGVVNVDALNSVALANYEMCLRDHSAILEHRKWLSSDWEPGLMKCDCGKELAMHGGGYDIHCDCGRSYNPSGQMLAPRSQWGEETGETAADYDRGVSDPESAFDGDY